MRGNAKKFYVVFWAVLFLLLPADGPFAAPTYKIDASHSTFGFAVKHMNIGVTRGEFTDVSGEITFDNEDLSAFRAWVVIKTESIDTHLEARDKHLKSEAFFDAENYPTIIYVAKKISEKPSGYEIVGDLTMRGVTKEVAAAVSIRGPAKSPFGGEVIGISGETVIDRRDYGISWNDVMPDGGFVVGNDVRIIVDLEADKK